MASDEIEALWRIYDGEMIPSEIARIPTRTLRAVSEHLNAAAQRRSPSKATQFQRGFIEGQKKLINELATIMQREMTDVEALIQRELNGDGE